MNDKEFNAAVNFLLKQNEKPGLIDIVAPGKIHSYLLTPDYTPLMMSGSILFDPPHRKRERKILDKNNKLVDCSRVEFEKFFGGKASVILKETTVPTAEIGVFQHVVTSFVRRPKKEDYWFVTDIICNQHTSFNSKSYDRAMEYHDATVKNILKKENLL